MKLPKTGPCTQPAQPSGRRLLYLAALGVVYGDIGTSPLYAIRECFHGEYGIEPNPANVLGVLSLMVWSLVLVVSLKYLTFVLRADNRGEGGVMALVALVSERRDLVDNHRWLLTAVGVFAASLLYGDGMITPSISVLSAVEGLTNVTPAFTPYVIPGTVVILLLLFLLQRRGTRGVGTLFGPVTMVWFLVIATLGVKSILSRPQVLAAFNPLLGIGFVLRNRLHGFIVLGAVFLVVTGAEALYADLGHFGRRPIRLAWFTLVLPALLCSYFGQAAILLVDPEQAYHPFYALAPRWLLIPLVILATFATIIASQAVISGAFSLTRQAIQLGYLPRLKVVHTSATEMGQIYVPQVNWLLMAATVALVLGFRSSSKLAAAYGVAVTTTMLITTILFFVVARKKWAWGTAAAGIPSVIFLVIDLGFFGANISKITHGAWFPLVVGGVAFSLLTTWRKGRAILVKKLYGRNPSLREFLRNIASDPPRRVPGQAVFMAGSPSATPPALLHNLKHNRVLHDEIAVLTISTEEVPVVPKEEKVEVQEIERAFYVVRAHYGFMEEPNVPEVLALAREKGLDFELADVSFFIGRERIMPDRRPLMPLWQEKLFSFMSRNAQGATAYFQIPPDQVVEIGAQIEI